MTAQEMSLSGSASLSDAEPFRALVITASVQLGPASYYPSWLIPFMRARLTMRFGPGSRTLAAPMPAQPRRFPRFFHDPPK